MHISRKYLTYILFLLHISSTTSGTMATHLLKSLTSLDNVCIGAIGNIIEENVQLCHKKLLYKLAPDQVLIIVVNVYFHIKHGSVGEG